ncbi:MAG: prepilin-type N-terminal cleavage/methylation domain-containing protein [Phycisphaerae bacterium]|nr:prepilin-type N-terminal cleavage/methylation domain-containing protein [Phycisphaerae bacterium]
MDLDNLKPTNRPSSIVNRQSQSAFTLIELMIVVSILGILAAIVYPEFQGHVQQAKEAQAKANLKLLREAIERYAAEHGGVPPGHISNNPNNPPTFVILQNQLTVTKKYLSTLPKNPFSDQSIIRVLSSEQTLDEATAAIYSPFDAGWIYHPATKSIKLNWPGTDSQGVKFFDY